MRLTDRLARVGCALSCIVLSVGCGPRMPVLHGVPAERSSPLVEEVLSAPVGNDFEGLAYAQRALTRMAIAPEAELARAAYERAVLTAWLDVLSPAPPDEGRTVRDAIEHERRLGPSSLEALRREAIAVAKRRGIASDRGNDVYQIELEPFEAFLNERRVWPQDGHPAVVAADARLHRSSCSERRVCWEAFVADALGFLAGVLGPGAAIGLALAVTTRRLQRKNGPNEISWYAVPRWATALALASGPVLAAVLWIFVSRDLDPQIAWVLLPFVVLLSPSGLSSGLSISIVALGTLFFSRRWLA